MRKLIIVLLVLAAVPASAQTSRTTCHDSGATRICETFNSMGSMVSRSRCYQSATTTRCDTQSFGSSSSSSSSTTTILPGK